MAAKGRTRKAKKDSRAIARSPARRHAAARQAGVLLLAGFAVFLFLALVSYAPDLGGRGNWCGRIGAALARPVLSALGFSSFLLIGLGAFWGGARLAGRRVPRPLVKITGTILLTLSFGALVTLLLDPADYRAGGLSGPGGLAGYGLANRLTWLAGAAGAFLVSLVGTLVGLTLATDWLFLDLGRDVANAANALWRRAAEYAPHFLRAAGAGARAFRSMVPATGLAGSGGGTATIEPPPAKEKPSRRAPKKEEPKVETPPEPEPAPEEEPEEEKRPVREARRREIERREREAAEKEAKEAAEREAALAAAAEPAEEEPEDEPEPEPPAAARPEPKPRPVVPPPKPKKQRAATGDWTFPPIDLLDPVKRRDPRAQEAMIKENAEILEETLREFKVDAEVVGFTRGPVVTLYELDLAAGIKVNRIHNLSEDLAVALKAGSVRVVAPLPGKSTIGVEVPNPVRDDVRLRDLMESGTFERNSGFLPLLLGSDVSGLPLIEDLTTMPHGLIAGSTGSGKSVCINSVLISLLLTRTPDQVRMILIDPKQVELAFFQKVPHLLAPVVTDMKKAVAVLEWLVDQMEERYALFHTMEVRNIHSYNDLGKKKIAERKKELGITEEDEEVGGAIPEHLPYIVVVVDELADLMMVAGKEIENLITRLAQKSRAVGIHIILATQRPSTDVITGLIKANMPCRLSFQVASKIDSRVILDQNGAEKLLGRGDMLYLPPRSSHLVRAQGTFVSDGEVKRVVKYLAERSEQEFEESLTLAQSGQMLDEDEKDPLYDDAVRIILSEQRGSASLLQRALGVGYTRGSRLMDQMHKEGLVGPYKGSKARDVLMSLEEYEELVASRR